MFINFYVPDNSCIVCDKHVVVKLWCIAFIIVNHVFRLLFDVLLFLYGNNKRWIVFLIYKPVTKYFIFLLIEMDDVLKYSDFLIFPTIVPMINYKYNKTFLFYLGMNGLYRHSCWFSFWHNFVVAVCKGPKIR